MDTLIKKYTIFDDKPRQRMVEKTTETFCPTSQQHWRDWLQEHHAAKQSVWLIYYKKKAGKPTLTWSQAVDEALCFGWIDSVAKPIDEETYKQFFSRRKPKSVWSKINKEKVQRLIDSGLITPAGLVCVETAKQNGAWTSIDNAQAELIPPDLAGELQKRPDAERYFLQLSRSDRRAILQWLLMAKRPETRQNRITELVELASQSLKPKQFRGRKKEHVVAK